VINGPIKASTTVIAAARAGKLVDIPRYLTHSW
jgi:hypothetical protein